MRIWVSLVVLLYLTMNNSVAQTPFDEGLTKDYSGTIANSQMYGGGELRYQLLHKRFDGTLYYYELVLVSGKTQQVIIPMLVRNLLNSTYFEFQFRDEPRMVLMAIYSKTRKWLRVKGIVPEKCKTANEEWARINNLENYNSLFGSILAEMDRNVNLSCLLGN